MQLEFSSSSPKKKFLLRFFSASTRQTSQELWIFLCIFEFSALLMVQLYYFFFFLCFYWESFRETHDHATGSIDGFKRNETSVSSHRHRMSLDVFRSARRVSRSFRHRARLCGWENERRAEVERAAKREKWEIFAQIFLLSQLRERIKKLRRGTFILHWTVKVCNSSVSMQNAALAWPGLLCWCCHSTTTENRWFLLALRKFSSSTLIATFSLFFYWRLVKILKFLQFAIFSAYLTSKSSREIYSVIIKKNRRHLIFFHFLPLPSKLELN